VFPFHDRQWKVREQVRSERDVRELRLPGKRESCAGTNAQSIRVCIASSRMTAMYVERERERKDYCRAGTEASSLSYCTRDW
jgi:hypothetical protein